MYEDSGVPEDEIKNRSERKSFTRNWVSDGSPFLLLLCLLKPKTLML